MKCDRCRKETTTYKYLNDNLCYPCNIAIYYKKEDELIEHREHINRIADSIERFMREQNAN